MIKDNYKWIFDGINNIGKTMPMGFLLKKHTNGQYLNSFRLQPVDTLYFNNQVRRKLEDTKKKFENKEIKIRNFDHEETGEDAIYILDVSKHRYIQTTIDIIFKKSRANEIGELKVNTNAKFSAMLFDIENGKSIIALDFVYIYDKAFKKFGLVATYDAFGLKELSKGAVLAFKIGLPCLYFEETNKLVVFKRKDVEHIFNLKEYYQKKARIPFQKLTDKKIIDMNYEVFESEIDNITTVRKINNMIDNEYFTKDIKFYKKYESFFKKHPNINDKLTQLCIKNGKVSIHDKDSLLSFLSLTRHELQQDVIDDEKFFIAYQKRKVETKK